MARSRVYPTKDDGERVRGLVDEGLRRGEQRLGEADVEVYLSWINDDFVAETMLGVSGYVDADTADTVYLNVVPDGYQDNGVVGTTVHEYVHVWEFQEFNRWEHRWERLRGEGLAQVLQSELVDYTPPYSSSHTVDDVADQWGPARDMLFEPVQKYVDGLFITDDDDALPNWYGYSASYHAVERLLQDNSVEDVMGMGGEAFVSSLDEFYGER
jgi:uncharacterized protein YjaZ